VGAAGAAVALVDGEHLEYTVGTGLGAMLLGVRIPANASTSFSQLRKEPVVETYAWQDTALKMRIASRVLSVPIYRSGRLAGCLQVFSRAGHFDAHNVHACELMSAIVSYSIGNEAPHAEGTFLKAMVAGKEKEAHLEHANPPLNGNRNGAKGSPTVNPTKSADKALVAPPDAGFHEPSSKAIAGQNPEPEFEDIPNLDDLIRQLQQAESPCEEPPQERKAPASLLRWPIHAPANDHTHGSRLSATELTEGVEAEMPRLETPASAAEVVAPAGRAVGSPSSETHSVNPPSGSPHEKNLWSRLKPICYPVFVLVFAIVVRIGWGTQSWPLEILIYVLLVFTTLEMHQRLSKH
jgi:hypothetical protein